MRHSQRLSFGEFLKDIRLVITSPKHRFAVIQDRGASWGSLALLIVPIYFGFSYAGGIYFSREPFPGYSLIPPLIVAFVTVYLKLYLLHISAHVLQGSGGADAGRGRFSDLTVVFGYTGVPSILAILLATALFLLIPEDIGYVTRNFKTISISVTVAVGLALFAWNLILIVLALRTVYAMRDLKIVIAFILGTVLIVVPALCTLWIVAPVHVDFVYMQPILSGKILHFFASDPTSTMSSNTKIAIHVDRLAYHFRPPERFELVVFVRNQPKPQEGDQRIRTVWGTRSIFSWDDEDSVAGRVVGLPGDGIEIAGGQLHINGQIWEEPYITAENRSEDSLEFRTLGPSEYLILPENRHLLGELKQELVVNRSRISGREVINRWPLGWWFFRSTVFLKGRPAAAIPTR